ncbi:hypothetical protein ACIQM4_20050 [Streptomyces sp. NPDC091272]|uniref:hypothetical protein n=1 Tax=Streptomyces sp. NPDC091272 TaxID=3365981 RepID=UPI0037FC503E
MTSAHPSLAEILEGEGPDHEDLLVAVVAHGVIIAVDGSGSVVFIHGEDGKPWLPAFADEATCARDVVHGTPFLCDAARLLDIAARTGVRTMTVASATQCATVPIALVGRAAGR